MFPIRLVLAKLLIALDGKSLYPIPFKNKIIFGNGIDLQYAAKTETN